MNRPELEKYLLREVGIPVVDVWQTIEAEKVVKIERDAGRISKKKAVESLGLLQYWLAIHRAAFHWTAGCIDVKQREYHFNCREFFREVTQ